MLQERRGPAVVARSRGEGAYYAERGGGGLEGFDGAAEEVEEGFVRGEERAGVHVALDGERDVGVGRDDGHCGNPAGG